LIQNENFENSTSKKKPKNAILQPDKKFVATVGRGLQIKLFLKIWILRIKFHRNNFMGQKKLSLENMS